MFRSDTCQVTSLGKVAVWHYGAWCSLYCTCSSLTLTGQANNKWVSYKEGHFTYYDFLKALIYVGSYLSITSHMTRLVRFSW